MRRSVDRIVFLDRDGVINHPVIRDGRPYSPMRSEDLRIIDGVVESCARLRAAGFGLVLMTNQPEIARSNLSWVELDAMHDRLEDLLALDLVLVCPHDDADACTCRKPAPGLVLEGASSLGCDPSDCSVIGDRWRDVEVAHRVGAQAYFVDFGWKERAPDPPFVAVKSLAHATAMILGESEPTG